LENIKPVSNGIRPRVLPSVNDNLMTWRYRVTRAAGIKTKYRVFQKE